jgi:uncharacterized protein
MRHANYPWHAWLCGRTVLAMNATENRQLVQGIFEQLARGNSRPLIDAMAEDFRWIFPGAWSWSGTWEPKDVVLDRLLRPLFDQFADRYRSEAELIVADEAHVVVQARGRVTTVRGRPYHNTYCFIFYVRDGKLAEVVEHCDTALVERELDAPPR